MPSSIKVHTLPNGLQLLGEQDLAAKSAAIGFFVKTGSRDEVSREAGLSHFLEHMMFKGTATRTALDITHQMGNIGAQTNAFTSEENTVYYAGILPEYFPQMQELLSDMLRPTLAPEEFDTEKKVILEEIALYYDRPQFFLFEQAFRDYFGGHPAGNSVLGTTESVGAISRDEMKDYFERRYVPNNVACVAAGNFSWEAFVHDAERYAGGWRARDVARQTTRYPARKLQKEYRRKNLNQAHYLLLSESAGVADEERYDLGLLAIILGDSSGSKLYWELVDTGIAESAGADSDERDGTGVFLVSASMDPRRIDEVAKIIERVIKDPSLFDDQELERAKTKCMARIVLNGELPMGRLMSIGLEWNNRKRVQALKEVVERVRAVTRRSILQALERYPLKQWGEFRLLPE